MIRLRSMGLACPEDLIPFLQYSVFMLDSAMTRCFLTLEGDKAVGIEEHTFRGGLAIIKIVGITGI